MQLDAKFVTIKVKDGSGQSIEVKLGEGTVTYSEKKPRVYVKNRGKLDTVRNGDEDPVDVNIDAVWEHITTNGISGAIPTVEDALKKRGPAVGWTSTSSDPCEPYAVDIELTYDPDCATDEIEIITLADFRYETADHDLKAGTLKFAGKANVTEASVVRVAQT